MLFRFNSEMRSLFHSFRLWYTTRSDFAIPDMLRILKVRRHRRDTNNRCDGDNREDYCRRNAVARLFLSACVAETQLLPAHELIGTCRASRYTGRNQSFRSTRSRALEVIV
jgi:hypothetical protein